MKGISVVLILAIFMGNIFCYMPVSAVATKRITMTRLYNNGDCLPVEEGDTVTIESREEMIMFSSYCNYAYDGVGDMQGVTVELLNDIRMSAYTFSYDEETMRIGISWYDGLEAVYDVNSRRFYDDFHSERANDYKWREDEFSAIKEFKGTFDGNGHYIVGMFENGIDRSCILFDWIRNGQIRNLNLSHFFSSNPHCSVLSYYFSGEIENCHASDIYLCGSGSLLGTTFSSDKVSVVDCSAEIYMFPKLTCDGSSGSFIEAINWESEVMMERNYATGLIYGKTPRGRYENVAVGGMVGDISNMENKEENASKLEIRNCVSEVDIDITGDAGDCIWTGGIVGDISTYTDVYLFNCENRGDISISGGAAGGLIGRSCKPGFKGITGTVIDQCRNTGKISDSYIAGGIAGLAERIEIRNTENAGDVCFKDCEAGSDVSEQDPGGLGGIVGRMKTIGLSNGAITVIKNSFCSGNVMGEKVHMGGIIGAIGAEKGSLEIDNVCVYGEVGAEAEDAAGIVLGEVKVNAVVGSLSVGEVYYREQKTSSVSGDGTELPVCMYPVSEAQMSGTEKDTYIGQGDFAQTVNLCDALNSWCRAQGESAGMIGWKQGEVFPILEMDETAKPEKPDPIVLPTFMPTPEPTEEPIPESTETPTQKPTLKPTEAPTQKPTETPTPKPTIIPTERPTQKPTLKPTEAPTQKPTLKPTPKPTIIPTETPMLKPTEAPTQSPAPIALPTVTPLPTVSPLATLLPAPSGKPVVKPTTPPKTDPKKKKMKAPVFSLKKDRTASGKRYVSIRLKQYQGTYVEIWAGRRRKGSKKLIYSKLKIKKNNIRKVKGVFNFQYAKQKGILVFRIRTYSKKGKKRIYSYKSKGKRIRLT